MRCCPYSLLPSSKPKGKTWVLIFMMVLLAGWQDAIGENMPAEYYVNTQILNVRKGPGSAYKKIGSIRRNTHVTVYEEKWGNALLWGEIRYKRNIGYVAMKYLERKKAIQPKLATDYNQTSRYDENGFWDWLPSLKKLWETVKTILLVLVVILVIAFWGQVVQILVFVGICMGIGALISYLFVGEPTIGAYIGLAVAILIGLRLLILTFSVTLSGTLWLLYLAFSSPLFYSNRLQHILSEPWRYIFKTSWIEEKTKPYLRISLEIIQVILYIAITPLRVFNAVMYNIVVYGVTELYDLLFEVLKPSSEDEGADSTLCWLMCLPIRIVKYPIYHGVLVITEGIVWTVIDTFIPAITLYHGTDLTAAQAIAGNPKRNEWKKTTSKWTNGTFAASNSSWGGIGVYFTSKRSVAQKYARNAYRLSDNNPVMIVCRVSLGRIINYALAPYNVYRNAGENGNPTVINSYADINRYTTGEWWNQKGEYWEFCLLDWKNKYNSPWRIRPVYIFNFRTCTAQHIKGGLRHWLYDKSIIK